MVGSRAMAVFLLLLSVLLSVYAAPSAANQESSSRRLLLTSKLQQHRSSAHPDATLHVPTVLRDSGMPGLASVPQRGRLLAAGRWGKPAATAATTAGPDVVPETLPANAAADPFAEEEKLLAEEAALGSKDPGALPAAAVPAGGKRASTLPNKLPAGAKPLPADPAGAAGAADGGPGLVAGGAAAGAGKVTPGAAGKPTGKPTGKPAGKPVATAAGTAAGADGALPLGNDAMAVPKPVGKNPAKTGPLDTAAGGPLNRDAAALPGGEGGVVPGAAGALPGGSAGKGAGGKGKPAAAAGGAAALAGKKASKGDLAGEGVPEGEVPADAGEGATAAEEVFAEDPGFAGAEETGKKEYPLAGGNKGLGGGVLPQAKTAGGPGRVPGAAPLGYTFRKGGAGKTTGPDDLPPVDEAALEGGAETPEEKLSGETSPDDALSDAEAALRQDEGVPTTKKPKPLGAGKPAVDPAAAGKATGALAGKKGRPLADVPPEGEIPEVPEGEIPGEEAIPSDVEGVGPEAVGPARGGTLAGGLKKKRASSAAVPVAVPVPAPAPAPVPKALPGSAGLAGGKGKLPGKGKTAAGGIVAAAPAPVPAAAVVPVPVKKGGKGKPAEIPDEVLPDEGLPREGLPEESVAEESLPEEGLPEDKPRGGGADKRPVEETIDDGWADMQGGGEGGAESEAAGEAGGGKGGKRPYPEADPYGDEGTGGAEPGREWNTGRDGFGGEPRDDYTEEYMPEDKGEGFGGGRKPAGGDASEEVPEGEDFGGGEKGSALEGEPESTGTRAEATSDIPKESEGTPGLEGTEREGEGSEELPAEGEGLNADVPKPETETAPVAAGEGSATIEEPTESPWEPYIAPVMWLIYQFFTPEQAKFLGIGLLGGLVITCAIVTCCCCCCGGALRRSRHAGQKYEEVPTKGGEVDLSMAFGQNAVAKKGGRGGVGSGDGWDDNWEEEEEEEWQDSPKTTRPVAGGRRGNGGSSSAGGMSKSNGVAAAATKSDPLQKLVEAAVGTASGEGDVEGVSPAEPTGKPRGARKGAKTGGDAGGGGGKKKGGGKLVVTKGKGLVNDEEGGWDL